ncbi:hypothetical protein IGI04_035533 [Brassica rapa subsp. trilocularis]|uniref:Uncharacterized protein n=1 Tax=Brassica rapa subsp. trilocularis TaxID=1813537 RepID=A0ABQ7LBV1_BRACM|nr:hypothetical protein IGI04_035533 [Brassica rapa subsp. trilocularis]
MLLTPMPEIGLGFSRFDISPSPLSEISVTRVGSFAPCRYLTDVIVISAPASS